MAPENSYRSPTSRGAPEPASQWQPAQRFSRKHALAAARIARIFKELLRPQVTQAVRASQPDSKCTGGAPAAAIFGAWFHIAAAISVSVSAFDPAAQFGPCPMTRGAALRVEEGLAVRAGRRFEIAALCRAFREDCGRTPADPQDPARSVGAGKCALPRPPPACAASGSTSRRPSANGVFIARPLADRRGPRPHRRVQPVALRAAAIAEHPLSAAGIAWLFEESGGVKVREQVRGGLLVQVAGANAASRIDAHMVGAWFHMVAASDAGVKLRSTRRPRSGPMRPPFPLTL